MQIKALTTQLRTMRRKLKQERNHINFKKTQLRSRRRRTRRRKPVYECTVYHIDTISWNSLAISKLNHLSRLWLKTKRKTKFDNEQQQQTTSVGKHVVVQKKKKNMKNDKRHLICTLNHYYSQQTLKIILSYFLTEHKCICMCVYFLKNRLYRKLYKGVSVYGYG